MSAVRTLLNLHPGETRATGLFVLLGFLWSFGTYGMFTLSEGAFLEFVGAHQIPLCYSLIAFSLCSLSAFLIYLLNHTSINRLFFGLVAVSSGVLLILYFLHGAIAVASSPSYWFVFRVIGWLLPISSYICFWAFIDQYFDLQDGKRLFAFFNAFLLLGDFLAAVSISFFIKLVGMGPLILLFAITVAAALPLILMISKGAGPILEAHQEQGDPATPLTWREAISSIIKSRFTLLLLLFYLTMQLLCIVTEFNYMDEFEQHFSHRSMHELTRFIGFCGACISGFNMLLSLLFYSRLVKKIGVNNAILIGPAVFLLLFGCWFWKSGISIAIFGMVARESLSYVMDDNNLNLLLSGVPSKIKNQIRITVESFFEPAGMLLSAFLLFSFRGHSLYLGFSVAIFALLIVLCLRSHYPKAIFQNLVTHTMRFGKRAVDWIGKGEKREVEFRLLTHLKDNHESSQLLAYEYLLRLHNPQLLGRLLNHLNVLSIPGKIQAIKLLADSEFATHPNVIKKLKRLRRLLPYPQLRATIHFYEARHQLIRPESVLHDLYSDDLEHVASAILVLKTSPHSEQLPTFCQQADERLEELLNDRDEKKMAAAIQILGFAKCQDSLPLFFANLDHFSTRVSRYSAEAISRLDCNRYEITELASKLVDIDDYLTRQYCLDAIEKCADHLAIIPLIKGSQSLRPCERKRIESIGSIHGKKLSADLIKLVQDSECQENCRLLAAKILAKADRKSLQNIVEKLVPDELLQAYDHFFHASTIQSQFPDQDLTLLKSACMTRFHVIIDFMVQLVGIANEIEESEVLAMSLWSRNKKIRAHALETLEKTASLRLSQLLIPLICEDEETKIYRFLKMGGTPLGIKELLDRMCTSISSTDRLIARGLMKKLDLQEREENQRATELESVR